MGAWIETELCRYLQFENLSHPTLVRGLKLLDLETSVTRYEVAPYVGAWIETKVLVCKLEMKKVAPYVGAWIET